MAKAQARERAHQIRAVAYASKADSFRHVSLAAKLPIVPVAGHSVLSGYHPFGTEADPLPLMNKLAGEGWTTALPVILGKGQPLEFRRWYVGEPLIPGKWGIPRPPEHCPVVSPDVLLVPLLAFDRRGYRLGYGGGFYDRTLQRMRSMKPVVAIGVAFREQEVAEIPRESYDAALDYVLTDAELIDAGSLKSA